ncbi:N-6 DNA methylase, partial [Serratia sp. IR-2025]
MTQLTLDILAPANTPDRLRHVGQNGYDHYRREFIRLFRETARYHHRHEVFRDFAEMATLAVQNVFLRSPDLEKEYLAIAGRYQPDDVNRMTQLLGCLTGALECQPGDFLGQIFMELEIGSDHMGQFFTPYHLSALMARLTAGDVLSELEHKPFITLQEPAVGAGSMVIAFAEMLAEQGINYQDKLFASCMDIDGKRLIQTVFHFRPCFLPWTLSRTWTLPWTKIRLTPE